MNRRKADSNGEASYFRESCFPDKADGRNPVSRGVKKGPADMLRQKADSSGEASRFRENCCPDKVDGHNSGFPGLKKDQGDMPLRKAASNPDFQAEPDQETDFPAVGSTPDSRKKARRGDLFRSFAGKARPLEEKYTEYLFAVEVGEGAA